MTFILFLLLIAALIVFGIIKHKAWQASLWAGTQAHARPLKYLSGPMAVRPTILKNKVPLGYRLSSLYFGCVLMIELELWITVFRSIFSTL